MFIYNYIKYKKGDSNEFIIKHKTEENRNLKT